MDKKIKRLVLAALATAIIFIVTRIYMPVPGSGYIHLGDTFIYLFACLLPMPYGIFAAAIGSSLSDLLSPYAIYALPTFIIKASMAAMFTSKKITFSIRNIVALILASIILTSGYYIADLLIDDSFAFANLPFNAIQATASAVLFITLSIILSKVKAYTSFREELM